MACALPHKSAASVNTSQERCDNFSITLGRRERCLCPRSWQVGLRGALCTLAALPLFLGTEGSKVRGKCTPEYVCNADVDLYSGFQFQSVQKGVKWTELIWQQRRVGKKLPPFIHFNEATVPTKTALKKRLSGKEVEPGSAFAASCFVQTHTCEYTFLVDFLFNTLPDDRSSWGENDLCSKILPRSVKPSNSLDLRLNLVFLHIPSSYWWLKLQTNAAPGPF